MKYLILDYETRSEADLRKVGAFEYSQHPSTEIICASWRWGTREELQAAPTKSWAPAHEGGAQHFGELLRALRDKDTVVVAHNALFEQVITRNVFARLMPSKPELREIPHARWMCTAAMAASHALPRNLEGACLALKLPVQKDMEGRRLILKWCKPRKATKASDAKWCSDPEELARLIQYCETDVAAETELFLALPPLSLAEGGVWLLDQEINFRGFEVDRDLVAQILSMIETETSNLNKETRKLTSGALNSTNQREAMLEWLTSNADVYLPDLRSKTVADFLSGNAVQGDAKRLLEIRQSVSKTSTKKYQAFEARSRFDSRVRDILVYHSASTGRWGGSGVQPHNLPRPSLTQEQIDHAIQIIKGEDSLVTRLRYIEALYGNPMEVFSSCLRSVIVAPKGRELFCADYAAIEARVLFWVADHEDGLRAFRENLDSYKEMAAFVYAKDIHDVQKNERQLGKQIILGAGFGMGWRKFLITCKTYNIEIDEEMAERAIKGYRTLHSLVVRLWANIERAARLAVQNPGKRYKINHTRWWVENDFLYCELPSGRRLAYYGPEIQYDPTPWDDKRPVLYHWGVDSLSKKWTRTGTYGGKLTENVVQAVARDLMANAMLTVRAAGFDIVLSVHDELVAERDAGEASAADFEKAMAVVPAWATGCPIRVEGWKGTRYRK